MAENEQSREDLQERIRELEKQLSELAPLQESHEKSRTELSELKHQSRALLNASSDTVLIIDQVGTIIVINEAGAMRFRRSPEELVGVSIYDILPNELVGKRKRWVSHAVETRKPIQFKDEHHGVTYGHRLHPYVDERNNAVRVAIYTRDISENEKAIRALRDSEERYKAILEDQTELICRYLPDGRLSYVNEAYARYYGKDRHELINRNFIPHIPDTDLRLIHQHISSLSHDKPVTSFEHQIILESGERRWQNWTHRAIYDAVGQLTEYQAVGRDVTRRRMAQELLRESERRYKSLFEDSPISLWEEDFSHVKYYLDSLRDQGIINFRAFFDENPEMVTHCAQLVELVDVNIATLQFFCAESKKDLLAGLDRVFTEKSLLAFKEELVALAEGKRIYEAESEHKTLEGETKFVSIHLSVAPGAEDTLNKVLVSILDITERCNAEQELRDHRAFLHQIIDTVPSPIFVKDREGRFVLVNKAMAELYGSKTPSELVGHKGEDFNPHEDEINVFRAEDLDVLDSHKPIFIPQRVVTNARGEKRIHATTKLPLAGKQQILGVAVDITERKMAEAERAKMERHFHQAQKMQALGTLAGGIAHDFNNMIFAILGFIRLALKQAETGSKLEEYLLQVQSAGMRASELVRQILTFSRQTDKEMKPVHLTSLFKEVGKMLRATLPATIDFRIDVDESLSEDDDIIIGDPTQIHQVLMNLCTNAMHSMRETGGLLRMALTPLTICENNQAQYPERAHGEYLQLEVYDTGCGMDQAIIEQIFDPFFTTKNPGEGTGMGLSVVHGIVNSHGGSIQVESEIGKGSVFKVVLPMRKEEAASCPCPDETAPMGKEHILFVDDEALVVDMVREMLSQLGYRVTALTSPHTALARFKESPNDFDLLITDHTMPYLTGVDLAKQMLTLRPKLPIIMVTGYSEQLTPEEARNLGIKEFLMKPIIEEHLAQTIRQVLETTSREEVCPD